jgi:hypothetical protein
LVREYCITCYMSVHILGLLGSSLASPICIPRSVADPAGRLVQATRLFASTRSRLRSLDKENEDVMHMQNPYGVGIRKRGKRFRLGSGARLNEPRSMATPHCVTSLWLTTGAIMLALVEASNGVNNQLDSMTALSKAKTTYAQESGEPGNSDFLGKNRGNVIPKEDTDSGLQHAPSEQPKYTSDRLWIDIIWIVSNCSFVLFMHPGGQGDDRSMIRGPAWDPAGNVPYREWLREVYPWLATTQRMTPSAQAGAIQRGLRGTARTYAM